MRLFLSLCFVSVLAGLSFTTLSTHAEYLDQLRAAVVTHGQLSSVRADDDVAHSSSTNTVLFVGDVLLARNVERIMQTYGGQYPFAAFDWPPADYIFANYEGATPSVHQPTPDGGMSFSISTTSAASLLHTPITHLSLANNHSYDHGLSGYMHTNAFLSAMGFVPFGDQVVGETSVVYSELGSSTVAVLGLYALYNDVDMSELDSQLAAMQATSDIQVVYVHWGDEYTPVHNRAQENLAYDLSGAGVDLIIGHHPHVVQDIEFINNTLVVYSLGNFLFDQYFDQTVEEGLMVGMTVNNNTIDVTLYGVTSEGSRSQPQRMSAYDNDIFLHQLAKRSHARIRSQIEAGRITMSHPSLSNE